MYVRTIKRKNKDGSVVEYVQLAHNEWNQEKGFSQAKVVYSFGRRENLDLDAIKRLVKSLCRFLSPEDAVQAQQDLDSPSALRFIRSRPAGGAYLLKGLWDQLHIGACLSGAVKEREFTTPVQELPFGFCRPRKPRF